VQGSQHHDPSRHARQLPSGVILARGTRDLRSEPEPCNNAGGYYEWALGYLH
jgi:hypothetical protein